MSDHEIFLAIFVPMREECGPLCRALGARPLSALLGVPVYHAQIRGKNILVIQSGVGAKKTRQAIRNVFGAFAIQQCLMLGVAGGLHPDLRPGDVICPRWIGQGPLAHVRKWEHAVLDLPADYADISIISRGGLFQGETVYDHVMKGHLRQSLPDVLAIDMESAAFVETLKRVHCPGAIFRAIVDPLDFPMPPVHLWVRRRWISRVRFLSHMIRHPKDIKSLYDLKIYMGHALRSLVRMTPVLIDDLIHEKIKMRA